MKGHRMRALTGTLLLIAVVALTGCATMLERFGLPSEYERSIETLVVEAVMQAAAKEGITDVPRNDIVKWYRLAVESDEAAVIASDAIAYQSVSNRIVELIAEYRTQLSGGSEPASTGAEKDAE